MRILTVVRQVLDAEESVRIRNGEVDLTGSKLVVDTMDEYGVEQALRIRDSGAAVEVIALAVGPERTQDALRTVLAMGADRAIHIRTDAILDPIALSTVVAQVTQREQAELVFCGGQQADWDSHALGAATAERLHWPQVTWTNGLEFHGHSLSGKHDTDAGVEMFSVELPAVITTQQGLNEPRYPTVPNIMRAKKKELRVEPLEQFDASPKRKTIGAEVQAKTRLHKILDGKDAVAAAGELVRMLKDEAGVIA
ncbi:MAG TPA: electron transfer flavoprotein subunit beta/FixA family protein [Acidobacteriaceae bacterium]|nr:electron transfer flavoprotein subunit beta/FixA family protein [Acidobacteriaceae bacterium]